MVGDGLVLRADALAVFAQNLVNALQMFNGRGDAGWLTGIPDDPALDYVMGGLFILGIVLALYRVKSREQTYWFMFLSLIVLLIPSALSLANPGDNPSAVYAAGAMPSFLFLPLYPWCGACVCCRLSNSNWRWLAASGLLILVFGASARANYSSYFEGFDLVYRKASWNAVGNFNSGARIFAKHRRSRACLAYHLSLLG